MNTDVIAFFAAENLFRLKTEERQRERFDSLAKPFAAEFEREPTDEDFAMLMTYQAEKKQAKLEKEKAKLAKAETLPVASGFDTVSEHIQSLPAGAYVLTSAQNNTNVDANALAALLVFCERKGAKLMAGRLTYNKSGFSQPDVNAEGDDLWYDPAIKPYLVNGQIDLDGCYHFVADANVIPTAKHPIAGFDGITPAGIGAIIPASKISLKVSAAMKNAPTKIVTSTGAITKRNYILRKTGAIAAMEHNIGALYVNTVTGEIRHLEQMEGENGFFDIDGFYSADGFRTSIRGDVAAFQPGDIHAEKADWDNINKVVDLIQDLQPEHLLIHDVLDFSSRNHHNIKDPMFLHAQFVAGNTVENDLRTVAEVLDELTGASSAKVHIIESNHDLAIETWVKNADWKVDPINAEVYLKLALAKVEFQRENPGKPFNMLEFAYREIAQGEYASQIDFHKVDESLIIAGTEMGCHGHNGSNGAKGSPVGFRNLGIAMNTGHTHSPGINGRVYTAGVTASLEMGYNIGASSWALAHVVTYRNGQRQVLFS